MKGRVLNLSKAGQFVLFPRQSFAVLNQIAALNLAKPPLDKYHFDCFRPASIVYAVPCSKPRKLLRMLRQLNYAISFPIALM